MTDTCKFCGTTATPNDEKNCSSLEQAYQQTPLRPYGCPWFTKEYRQRHPKPTVVPERLNPLLKLEALQAADEAACRLDGMFRDLFNNEERMDLIVTIIRAATGSMLGVAVPSTPSHTPAD